MASAFGKTLALSALVITAISGSTAFAQPAYMPPPEASAAAGMTPGTAPGSAPGAVAWPDQVPNKHPGKPAPPPKAMAKPNGEMQKVLTTLDGLGPKPLETLSPPQARIQPGPADAVRFLLAKDKKAQTQNKLTIRETTYNSVAGMLPARIYTPEGKGPFPVIVYYHGGGWVLADLNTYDASARALAQMSKAIVVSAEYRHAPENKFPASHEDAFAAYQWVLKNAATFNGDPTRIAVAGESAGANLAANVSIMARDSKMSLPVYQLLVYPIASTDLNSPSYQENALAKPLNKSMMQWFFQQAIKTPEDLKSTRLNLISADLKGLPPTTVICAQIDPLRSEGELLAKLLTDAGVKTTEKTYDGVTHEFFGMAPLIHEAEDAQKMASDALKKAFKQ